MPPHGFNEVKAINSDRSRQAQEKETPGGEHCWTHGG
jgi:hypothetical protein